jgi:2-oxoglutarate dehydrogenase E2 component (dihydrolipoamide succinyltransferase)
MNRKKAPSPSIVLLNVPSMGESVSQAVVGRFLVDSGDLVESGQEVIELETDKLNQTLSAPADGVIEWVVELGETVAVGALLARIEAIEAAPKTPQVASKIEATELAPKAQKAKKSAQERSLVATLPGIASLEASFEKLKTESSSSKIRISREDTLLEAPFIESRQKEEKQLASGAETQNILPQPSSQEVKEIRERLPQMRKTIAERLLKAQQEAAMLTTFNEIDMHSVMQMREKWAEKFLQKHGVKLGFMSFFVKAVVGALKKVPSLNARIEKDEWVQRLDYHLGVAVSTEKGLVVPVIRDCERLSLADIEKQIAAMAVKAREGKITLSDLQGGSFTLTNGGVFGSLLSTPILNPPQSGILGMHKIQKRPVVNQREEIVVRPMMYVALTYDHRVVDGKQAVSFLVAIKEAIEQPEVMWLDI